MSLHNPSDRCAVNRLKIEYAMDIRCLKHGDGHGRPGQWVLAGEWDGVAYLDYVAEASTI